MDISGVVGFKMVKGGVKATELFCFMTDLVKEEISINSKRNSYFLWTMQKFIIQKIS